MAVGAAALLPGVPASDAGVAGAVLVLRADYGEGMRLTRRQRGRPHKTAPLHKWLRRGASAESADGWTPPAMWTWLPPRTRPLRWVRSGQRCPHFQHTTEPGDVKFS